MKAIAFLGDSLKQIRSFPKSTARDIGYALRNAQLGQQATHYRPMPTIGVGVEELRLSGAAGIYRVIYIARIADKIYVLHAFQKKSQRTAKSDLELPKHRFKEIRESHGHLSNL